ncbi:unnamed protein product [Cuscuta epithymum]|uniref:Glycosyltransferase n=1 Tax=Cuscuta epithymum TaxID=186058 RepID=A0AAV0FYB9_9ASTE|nr:unnamed protein product [Cuscuta epithymum]
MENHNNDDDLLHVVMFPFFAFGHISPFVQLSNKLSLHGVKISFFSAAGNAPRVQSMLTSSPPNTQIIPLTLPAVDGLPPGAESTAELSPTAVELLKVALNLMKPQIKSLLVQLKPHFVLFDFAHDWLPPMAADLGIKTIFYSVFIALSTAFATVPARLPEPGRKSPSLEEMKKPPPGFPQTPITSLRTFEARDFLYIFMSFDDNPSVYDRVLAGLNGCSAILAKTCYEMEGPYIDFVKSQFKKPLLLAGPVVPEPSSGGDLDEKWEKWLAQFEPNSVIYCSFGSETFLKDDQIKELALGLELTGLPFFLVLNIPASVEKSPELKRVLPEGFSERVKGRGIVHSGWVQQQQILAHTSVGCYVCHAGFSSVIEAMVNDCQLVMLPLRGDQFLNAKLVAADLKAGVEVNRRDEDGYFWKEDIQEAVQRAMGEEGTLTRENQKKWKKFLVDKEIQSKFIKDLVKEMRSMAALD